MSKTVYEIVTERILKDMEQGRIPWKQPWCFPSHVQSREGRAYSRSTGRPYSLVNQMLLGKPGEYMTYKQAQEAGGQVRKGEKAHPVVFWKLFHKETTDAEGNKKLKTIPLLRYYSVFHVDQTEGIEARVFKEDNVPEGPTFTPDQKAEAALTAYTGRERIPLRHIAGNRAYYSPARDEIVLPDRLQFKAGGAYYETALHEAVHSTGHKKRLARFDDGCAAFGTQTYSKEELVAEIGAASMLLEFGLNTEETDRNNSAYIQSWMKVLKDDPKMIVSAAGKAEKAVCFILGIEQEHGEETDHEEETDRKEETEQASESQLQLC